MCDDIIRSGPELMPSEISPYIIPTHEPTVQEMLTDLHIARTELDKIKTELAAKMADPEILRLITLKGNIATLLDVLVEKIKAKVIAELNAHLDKTMLPAGTSIRNKTIVTVTDQNALDKWVRETETGSKFLIIDTDAVSKYAQKVASTPAALPFVKIDKITEATIASDLSKFVKATEPEQKSSAPEEDIPF